MMEYDDSENAVQEAALEIDEDVNAELEFESTLNCKTGGGCCRD